MDSLYARELYASWPMRQDFDILELGKAVEIAPRESEENEFFMDLADWLRDNDYISFQQASESCIYSVALTEKGFSILGKAPIGTDVSLGSKMKEAAKTAGKDAGRAIIASLVGAMVSGAVTAIKS